MIFINSNSIKKKNNYNKRFYKMDKVAPVNILDLISLHEYHKFILVKFYIKIGYPLTSQPSINAIIGPYGVNIMNLQKRLEGLNDIFEKDTIVPIVLKVYDFDKYHIILKSPTLTYYLERMENSSNFVSIYQVYELVKKKKKSLEFLHIKEKSLYSIIVGSLKSNNKSIFL